MRNGVTLADLKNEIRIEGGLSTQSGHAVFTDQRLTQMINRTERFMSETEDWTSNNFEEQVVVAADGQYANLPTNITFSMITSVHVMFGSTWLPVEHGIGAAERSIYTTSQRASPIRKWEIQSPGNVNFEVWPIGAGAQTLLFAGSKKIGGMVLDTDVCVLDADVIVLRVAAQILGRDKKEDAALLLKTAGELTDAILKRQGATKRANVNLANAPSGRRLRPGIDFIPPGG